MLDSDLPAVKHDNAWPKIHFHNFVILLVKGLLYQQKMDQDTAPHGNNPDFSMKLGHIKDSHAVLQLFSHPDPIPGFLSPQFHTDLLYDCS